jgi:hypothetical protein
MSSDSKLSLGQAIDEMAKALNGLDDPSKSIAIKAVCELFSIAIDSSPLQNKEDKQQLTTGRQEEIPPKDRQSGLSQIDIRSLKEQKAPSSAVEMVCIMAYYLENHAPQNERKNIISSADISKYFRQAPYPLPKYAAQVLVDAKFAGYFDSVSHGKYKLNPVGHNLVVHTLPRKKTA